MLRYGGHIAVENLQDALPRQGRHRRCARVVAALLFAFFGFMVWYGWLYMERTMFQLTAVTQIPFAYIYSAMLIGGVLLIVHWLLVVRGYVLRREFASDAHFDASRERLAMNASLHPHRARPACSWRSACRSPSRSGLATAATLILAESYPLMVLLKETFTGIDSFPLMAVPFFILAAELMSGGSLTEVLLRFAGQFVGHRRGGLGYTNMVSLTFFSGISGSALADAAGPGSMLIRMMDKAGYDRSYAAALTASTAIVGPIIPPSIIMIIYALQDENVSVGRLFVAGIIPGLLIAVAMCVVNFHVSKQRNYRGDGEHAAAARSAAAPPGRRFPRILLPVVILGGMRAGWFTPTEASVVAVFYALVCGKFVYRTLEWKALPDILARSALLSASVLIIIGLSASFAWVLTIEGVPQTLAEWLGRA